MCFSFPRAILRAILCVLLSSVTGGDCSMLLQRCYNKQIVALKFVNFFFFIKKLSNFAFKIFKIFKQIKLTKI